MSFSGDGIQWEREGEGRTTWWMYLIYLYEIEQRKLLNLF
jgi:hypothetical protein